MRYFAQITVPIYAKSDKKAYEKAEKLRKKIEFKHDHTVLNSIVHNDFNTPEGRELNLPDL